MYKVLLVSEDQQQLNTLSAIISRQGSNLEIAGNLRDGNATLHFLRNCPVDILVLDIHCPSVNGIELLRKIRSENSHLRCIITAARAEVNCIQKVIPLGIENFLLTPLDPQILSETLDNTVQKLDTASSVHPHNASYTEATLLSDFSDANAQYMIDPVFKQHLLMQDYSGCLSYLDTLFSDDHLSPAMLRNRIVEIVVYVINVMRSYNINISKIVSDSTALFYQILNFHDIHDLHFWMKNFLSTALEELESKNLHYSPCIARAVIHIKKNFAQDISMKTMAYELNINAAYLGQLFKAETGQLFSVFLNQTRIEHAQKLLLETNLPLNEISQQCGYANISYFYNIFKKYTGKTPSQYRKSQTN